MLLVVLNRRVSPRNGPIFNLPLIYLSFNYGVLCYFTSGTEGPLVQVLAIVFALFVLRPSSIPCQIFVALAPFARTELAIPFFFAVIWLWIREKRFPWKLLLLGAFFSGSWVIFRIYYYAELFPLSFFLKNITEMTNACSALLYIEDPYTHGCYFFQHALEYGSENEIMKLCAEQLRKQEGTSELQAKKKIIFFALKDEEK